jgi:hypothetical protein
MKTSDSLKSFAPAFLKAQKAITFAAKDATNPHFRNKYADLPAVIDAIKPALNNAGIVFTQTPSPSESGFLSLTTRLIHESGEFIEDTATIPLPKADPQGYGSALTYGRRYALASISGLFQDDDDGNAASGVNHKQETTKPQAKSASVSITDKTREALINFMEDPKVAPRVEAAMKAYKVKSIDEFTEDQGQKIVTKLAAEIVNA